MNRLNVTKRKYFTCVYVRFYWSFNFIKLTLPNKKANDKKKHREDAVRLIDDDPR